MRLFKFYIVTVLFMSFSSYGQDAGAKKFFDEGMGNLNSKNFIEAIGSFTNAISQQPNYKEAYFERALAKEKLAQSIGYQSTEPCQDFAQAMNLGEVRAIKMLKNYCMNECFNINNAFFQPELVFCADFSNKVLTELPSDAYNKLIYLTKLNLFNNRITDIPSGFIDFNLLISLDMSSNRLTKINNMIGSFKYLEELKLNKNYIKTVDFAIGTLKNIKKIELKRNKLVAFPSHFLKLKQLEYLDLSENLITVFPENIGDMTGLKTLRLLGNEISKKEQKRIEKALPNCQIYFSN